MGVEASPQPLGLPPSSHLCSEPPDTSRCSLGPGLNKLWNINSALSRVPELHACPACAGRSVLVVTLPGKERHGVRKDQN